MKTDITTMVIKALKMDKGKDKDKEKGMHGGKKCPPGKTYRNGKCQ